MTIILSSILIWVIDTFIYIFNDNKNDINKMQCIFKAIGYCFFYIACTWFNEIIICNFRKMNYNTHKEIEERGIEDLIENNKTIISNNETTITLS